MILKCSRQVLWFHFVIRQRHERPLMPDVQVLGKGAFGKVLLVKDKVTKAIYAMKMLHKSVVLEREQVCDVGLSSANSIVFSLRFPLSFHVRHAFHRPITPRARDTRLRKFRTHSSSTCASLFKPQKNCAF